MESDEPDFQFPIFLTPEEESFFGKDRKRHGVTIK